MNEKISSLYEKHNYKNKNIEYLKNCNIYEYDMKRAGLNILRNTNSISEEDYNYLINMDKRKADVIIGKWLRDNPDISDLMMKEYIKIRKKFFELNNIEDDDEILSIKKDAIFVINHRCNNLDFDGYTFVNKNKYDSFIKINNYEFYLNSTTNKLDIKGMNHNSLYKQWEYFIKLIKTCMNLDIKGCKDKIFEILVDFKDDFIMFELDKEYYRDIATGEFILNFRCTDKLLGREEIPEELKEYLFTDGNLSFLNKFISIIL